MKFKTPQVPRNPHGALICLNAMVKGGCTSKSVPYNAVEKALLDRLINKQGRDLNARRLGEETEMKVTHLQQKIAAKRADLEQLFKLAMAAPDVVIIADKLSEAQEDMDRLQAELVSAKETPVSTEEMKAGEELFKKLVETNDHTLRVQVQTAIRRQVVKVEIAARCDLQDADLVAPQHRDPSGHYVFSENPKHVAVLTYAGGSVRGVDVTPFL